MHRDQSNAESDLPLHATRQIDALCDEFEAAIKVHPGTQLMPYLDRIDPKWRRALLEELTVLAVDGLRNSGASNPKEQLLANNSDLRDELTALIAWDGAGTRTELHDRTIGKATGLTIRCPHCQHAIELIVDAPLVEIECESCGDTFSLANDALDTRDALAVTRIAHFELLERLGMGEFGTVWKARDTELDRTVAVKIPRREKLDPLSVEKFMREARAAAQLQHPNIIRTHEVGREKDTLYIVSEYIRGVPLSLVIADHRLEVGESVLILAKIASALEHAHSEGVIHRDIKPSNILMDDHGEPHLMDFGLAKRSENEITITTEGAILGTPAYMSPEQARGEAHRVDGRSDLYSLGVILFQLLTGDLPFRGSIQMLLRKVINDEPPGPRWLDGRLPRDLDTICLKCMEKDPSRRYATAGELETDLRRYLAGKPIAARRVGALGRALRWARRNRAVAMLVAATVTALTAATIVSSIFGWKASVNAARVTDTLYDSLLQEIRLTNEVRKQGYGTTVGRLVERARTLGATRVDENELRRQLVLTMGDFVANLPIVIESPEDEIATICLNGDGRELVLGLTSGRILAYDAISGNQRGELMAFANSVDSIAITNDDKQLFAVDLGGAVRVWRRDGQDWSLDRRIQFDWNLDRNIQFGVNTKSVYISSAGEYAASVNGPALQIWDTATGKQLNTFATEPDWTIRNIAFDVPNRRLAATFSDYNADSVGWALWSLNTAELLHQVGMPSLGNSFPNGIDIAPQGDRLAIGFDEALIVYDLSNYQRTNFFGFDSTKAVAFSPTDSHLAASNIRGWVTMWNSTTNRQLATLHHPRRRRSRDDLVFSADGRRLASSNADSVQVWDLARTDEKTVMIGHEGGIPCAVFHPHGRILATGGKDDKVRFWNPLTGQIVQSLALGEAVQTLAFSSDGKLLAIGSMGRTGAPHLRLVDVASNKVTFEATPDMGNVHSLAWADGPAGRFLAGCGPHGVALWTVRENQPPRVEEVFKLDREWCLATLVNPGARIMIWAEDDWRLRAWDIVKGQEIPLNAPPMLQGWHGVAFLPDGETIIYVTKSGVAQLWNVKEDRSADSFGELGTFTAPHIAISPNGRWFAALTQPDVVSVWHTRSRQHMFSLRPDAGTIWSLAWDPTSEHLAVGQSDGGLAVWHLSRIRQKLADSELAWLDDD